MVGDGIWQENPRLHCPPKVPLPFRKMSNAHMGNHFYANGSLGTDRNKRRLNLTLILLKTDT
jgi:hypothetical protein